MFLLRDKGSCGVTYMTITMNWSQIVSFASQTENLYFSVLNVKKSFASHKLSSMNIFSSSDVANISE